MSGQDAFEHTVPVWYSVPMSDGDASPLDHDITVDACVIGAGIAGLATAYQLISDGLKVAVVDSGLIGGGETGRSSAHLSSAIDDRFYRIAALHGEEGARLAFQSHAAGIDWFEAISAKEGIDCEFQRVDGFLFLPPGENRELLEREREASQRAGVTGLRMLPRAPLPSFDTGPCLSFPRQGQCDPLAFVRGLAAAILRRGAQIYCHTHVDSIDDKKGLTIGCKPKGRIRAGALIVATNSPINTMVALHTKQHPYRTYAIAVPVEPGAVPLALFWDTAQTAGDEDGPYHYVRLQERVENPQAASEELLIVGGEDHKTGQADDAQKRWTRLEMWARERFPLSGPVRFRWSGQVLEPVDSIAYIGRSPGGMDNVYVLTGDSGMGLTHGALGAMLLADLIARRPNEWEKLYDPSRKSLRAALTYAEENLNVAAQYADWLAPGNVESTDAIPPGHGALIRRGLSLVACYRDPTGIVHECSAACPHLGGVVQWNSAEHTWDCPCHGSRFDAFGKVINGPAVSPLSPAEERAQKVEVRGAKKVKTAPSRTEKGRDPLIRPRGSQEDDRRSSKAKSKPTRISKQKARGRSKPR